MSLRLYVIRHGQTEWSLSGQHTGRTDIALTELGKTEARKISARVKNIRFSRVLVSPLQRARETCELAGLAKDAVTEADLTEWDNGDFEGRTAKDIRKSLPDWNLFRDGCTNGESPTQISNRVDRLINSLNEMHGNVALFTHGHLGRVLAARWVGLSVDFAQHLLLDTASVSILCYHRYQPDQPAILLWNSSSGELVDELSNQPAGAQIETLPATQEALQEWENEGGEVPSKSAAVPLRTSF